MYKFILASCALALTGMSVFAQPNLQEVKKELAPGGTIRAGINFNNPLLAHRDENTGELSGVAVDLTRELGQRLNLPVELIPFDSAGALSGSVKDGGWDVAYLAIDPARATDIEFTSAYIELEGTYLVPAGSALKRIEDVDHAGVRIAVTAKSAYDLFLSRELKQAQLVKFDTTPISIDMMVAQKLDAVAAVRTALISNAPRVPGSRILDGHFMTIPQAAGVPKGRPAAAQYLHDFIEDAKASGFVAAALKRHGLGPDDAIVAAGAQFSETHVITYLEFKALSIKQGVSLAKQYVRDTKAEAGNKEVVALQETNRPNRLVILEKWRDRASFERHDQAAHTQAFHQQLEAVDRAPYDERLAHGFLEDAKTGMVRARSLYVVTHLDVPGPKREAGEAILNELVPPMRTEPGRLRYEVYQQNDPRMNHFTLYAIWNDMSAFDDYGSGIPAARFRQTVAPLLGALYDERLYRLVE